ncbi:uncharacterized protein LOC122048231 [Zingiber officinale]|uniref:uncharacterized protein LOC122048231 n=1 Tax=Zingiber officinale TaxID=94328 RepID=UPI001C4CF8B8|nr:uncharacterized protein LOC122048231 [Zingiber officinale]
MLEEALSEQKEMRSEIKQLIQRLENSEKHQKMQDSQIAQITQSVSRAQASQKDEEFHRFLKKFKEICVEVPLLDALHQMPKFAKFLKGILSNRRKKGDFETIALTKGWSALFMVNSPPKLQGPRSFSIPYKISSELIPRAFYDLGASVSLLPYSPCKKLRLHSIKLIAMALQLADHSCKYPMGIVEDVPVEVGGCVIPTDFIIMDMKEDPKILIILGRPFLATAGALIDVKNHKLSLEFGKERIEFDLSSPSNYISFSQGNPIRIDARGVEKRTFRENSPPTDDKKYICPARAKLKAQTGTLTLGGESCFHGFSLH